MQTPHSVQSSQKPEISTSSESSVPLGLCLRDWFWLFILAVFPLGCWQALSWLTWGTVNGPIFKIIVILQVVTHTVFWFGYWYCHTAKKYQFERALILFHLLISGCFVLFIAHQSSPYNFEVALCYLPLMFIGYDRLHYSGKWLLCVGGCFGFLIMLMLSGVRFSVDELSFADKVQLTTHWLIFTVLLVVFTYFSRLCAQAIKAMNRKEMQLKEAMRMISQMTVHDPLTGLFNKHYLIKQLEKQKAIADRGQSGFVLGLLEIDHVPELIEHHSQEAADAVIKAVAETIDEHIRHLDYCARWSDSVFAIVLENAEAERTRAVFERICQSVADHSCYSYGIDRDISVCVGVTQYSVVEDWHITFERANEALISAQNKGVGQVCVSMATIRQVELVRDEQHRLQEKKS